MREQFNEAYPLEAWQVKANGEAVARAIQFQNLKREWEGFQRGYRAGAEAQRERWIPVSERLPELKCNAPQMVLMAIAGRELPEMGWKLIEENRWQSVETGPHDWPIYVNMDQVTHWMPLPDPPRFAPIEGEKE